MHRITLLSLIAALWLVPSPARAQVTLPMTSLEAYLLLDPVDTAQPARIVKLSDLGMHPGSLILIEPLGDFDNGPGGDEFSAMFAVFSSNDSLLQPNLLERVPGAIATELTTNTGVTCPSNLPNDIPEDFSVPVTGRQITVPAGATHLFIQPAECLFYDNTDPDGDYAVRLTLLSKTDVTGPAPGGLELLAPWPNPAGARVTLPFSLPTPGHARLALYAVDGRLVRVLLDGEAAAGRREISWDARDASGTPVPTGIYFARLSTPGGSVERRVTVFRGSR